MNEVLRSRVQINVELNRSLFSLVGVSSKRSIEKSESKFHSPSNSKRNDWHKCIDNHSLGHFPADLNVPCWHEIRERSVKETSKRNTSIIKGRVHKKHQECCVEELSNKDSIGN